MTGSGSGDASFGALVLAHYRTTWARTLLGDAVQHHFLAGTHFEAIAAVCRLQEKDVVPGESQHALDRRCHVFVKTVWKFDDYYGAASWRAHEATCDDATTFAPKLPKHDIHENQPSTGFPTGKGLVGWAVVFRWRGA